MLTLNSITLSKSYPYSSCTTSLILFYHVPPNPCSSQKSFARSSGLSPRDMYRSVVWSSSSSTRHRPIISDYVLRETSFIQLLIRFSIISAIAASSASLAVRSSLSATSHAVSPSYTPILRVSPGESVQLRNKRGSRPGLSVFLAASSYGA